MYNYILYKTDDHLDFDLVFQDLDAQYIFYILWTETFNIPQRC